MKLRHKKMARCCYRQYLRNGIPDWDGPEYDPWIHRAYCVERWERQFRSIR